MRFKVLGPLSVVDDRGNALGLGGPKQRAVLGMLLLHADRVVSIDTLVETLWGEEAPERARATLQVYIAHLRRLLADCADAGGLPQRLVRQSVGYRLRVAGDELDLHDFERLVAAGRTALQQQDAPTASALLREALELWRGRAFPDLAATTMPPAELAAVEERRLSALEDRFDADLDAGHDVELVAEIELLVTAHPLRERLHGQRIRALYRAGRQAEALEAYRTARDVLADELGIDPGPALQQLERAVLQHDPSLDPPARASRSRFVLPVPATALLGREQEVAALTAMLRDDTVRLVSLLGTGGIGKTRLALEVARAVQSDFPDGVFFVELAPLTDAALVLHAIAAALGVRETAGRPLALALRDRIQDHRVLLVLDNFEQVRRAATDVAALLTGAAQASVLVTSRAPLRLTGEREVFVPPLPLPELGRPSTEGLLQNPAVQLFIRRARSVTVEFEPSERDLTAIATICHRLDGLPLAIELAAARLRVLSPAAILDRLEDRLRLLTGGPRDLPVRQQTLRSTIEWSVDLAEPAQRDLFAQFAVFARSADLKAVEAVCRRDCSDPFDVLDLLDDLVGQGLLQRLQQPDGEIRFGMLETIGEYAKSLFERRPDASKIRRRHLEHYLSLAESMEPRLTGPDAMVSLDRLSVEVDNIRAAMNWAAGDSAPAEGDREGPLRLAAALWHFWEMRGPLGEGRHWLETMLAGAGSTSPSLRLRLCSGAGTLAWSQGDYSRAFELHERALRLAEELEDHSARAFALNNLGAQLYELHHGDRAAVMWRSAQSLALEVGDFGTAAAATHNLAELSLERADYTEARRLYEDALQMLTDSGDPWTLSLSLRGLAITMLREGDHEGARASLSRSLALAAGAGENSALADCIEALAIAAEADGEPEDAVRLVATARALRQRIAAPLQPHEQADLEALLQALHGQLSEDAFDRAWHEGSARPVDDVIKEL